MNHPTAQDARQLVEEITGRATISADRFAEGCCHYVYEVKLADGRSLVARLASAETRSQIQGGIHWHPQLAALGVPLPKMLHAGTEGEFAFMILERLPGSDLGSVYHGLNESQKRGLAEAVAEAQARCAQLPPASGYGYALSYADPVLQKTQSWREVLIADLERSRRRILTVGAVEDGVVDAVICRISRFNGYLGKVAPIAFLDDTTTRNVLVHHGALSGIVDVDTVCFGDPLLAPALTRMALLSRGFDTRYVDYWLDAIRATPEQRAVMDLYTAVFCVNFLGEQGQVFNRGASKVDQAKITALRVTLENLLADT